jgi:hypothetical protein
VFCFSLPTVGTVGYDMLSLAGLLFPIACAVGYHLSPFQGLAWGPVTWQKFSYCFSFPTVGTVGYDILLLAGLLFPMTCAVGYHLSPFQGLAWSPVTWQKFSYAPTGAMFRVLFLVSHGLHRVGYHLSPLQGSEGVLSPVRSVIF